MAKKVNNSNWDNEFFDDDSSYGKGTTDIENNIRNEINKIGKENKKKTHVSVLLSHEDFEYVRNLCFKKRKSKNEFFKAALEAYKRGEWDI